MNNVIDLATEKQKILQTFDQLEAEILNYQQQINNLEHQNQTLKQQTKSDNDLLTDDDNRKLYAELDLLKHQNNELENLLKTTKQRISELSGVLIDKESQIKELKANQPKRGNRFDINESDQLFEAKMEVSEKDKVIRNLEAKLDKLASNQVTEQSIIEKDHQIELLTQSIDNLEKANVDLIFETEELKSEIEQLKTDVPQVENMKINTELIPVSDTTELREIDNLLEQIIDHELNTSNLDVGRVISDLEGEFEFTDKAKLALKLLLDGGLNRDAFKKELMGNREIIDSFIGEVNGYFEDQYYFELISENKNYYTINQELFE